MHRLVTPGPKTDLARDWIIASTCPASMKCLCAHAHLLMHTRSGTSPARETIMQETKTQTTTPDKNGNLNPRVCSGHRTRLHNAPQVIVIPKQKSSLTMLAHLVSKEVVLILLLLPGGRRMILKGDGVVSH